MGWPLLVFSLEVFGHEKYVFVRVTKLGEGLKTEAGVQPTIKPLCLKVQAVDV